MVPSLQRSKIRMDRAAVVVQSVWRGRMVRVRAGKILLEMRARIAAAKAAVQEHMKLGNRTRAALGALLSSSSVAVCLKDISALEVASEHSIVCAMQIVQQGAVPVIYRLFGPMQPIHNISAAAKACSAHIGEPLQRLHFREQILARCLEGRGLRRHSR